MNICSSLFYFSHQEIISIPNVCPVQCLKHILWFFYFVWNPHVLSFFHRHIPSIWLFLFCIGKTTAFQKLQLTNRSAKSVALKIKSLHVIMAMGKVYLLCFAHLLGLTIVKEQTIRENMRSQWSIKVTMVFGRGTVDGSS